MPGMKEVSDEVVHSYDERQKRLKEIKTTTSHLLKDCQQAQEHLREELSEAKQAWQEAASCLHKKRRQRSK